VTTTTEAQSQAALIQAAHMALCDLGARLSISWVRREISLYERKVRAEGREDLAEFICRRAGVTDARATLNFKSFVYADPTGERAVSRVRRKRGF
jgi:hypothetical protein